MKPVIYTKDSIYITLHVITSVAEWARHYSYCVRVLCSKRTVIQEICQTSMLYLSFVFTFKIMAHAFWKLSQFSKRVNIQNAHVMWVCRPDSNPKTYSPQPSALPNKLLVFNVHNLKWSLFVCRYISFFNPCPSDRLMCTNKTCFAGVVTKQKMRNIYV